MRSLIRYFGAPESGIGPQLRPTGIDENLTRVHCDDDPTTVRDKGVWVTFAGTPYEYLQVCGDPWEGNEYHEGDKAVWTMSYARR